jgi:cobalt/nickel transport system ATP-binding protein
MINIQNLSFKYPDGRHALDQINLQIKPGEKVALVGPNGAGKSTLLLHLNGVLRGNGQITINDLEISRKNLATIRSLIGMVFQNPDDQLFSLTLAEDVAFGPTCQGIEKEAVKKKVKEALLAVQLEGFEDRNPYHLSGGEKKRASVATVLSMSPEYLVLDEPTSGLDPRSRRELISLLKSLPQTMIVATHDLAMVNELAGRVIVLKNGRIVADGAKEKILSDHDFLLENDLL